MNVDYLHAAAVLGGGTTTALLFGFRGWGLVGTAFLIGVMLQIALSLMQVLLGFHVTPAGILLLVGVVPSLLCIVVYRRTMRRSLGKNGLKILAALLAVGMLVVSLSWILPRYTLVTHVDTMQYLSIGRIATMESFPEGVSLQQLQKRALSFPVLHAPAAASGKYFLVLVNPLIALSTTVMLAWMAWCGLRGRFPGGAVALTLAVLGAALLATNNRFIMHALYLNAHLLISMCVLLIGGAGWLREIRAEVPERALFGVQMLAIPVLVMARPEGAVLAFLALLPSVVSSKTRRWQRIGLLSMVSLFTLWWHGYLGYQYLNTGSDVPSSVLGLAGLGCAGLVMAAVLGLGWIDRLVERYAPVIVEACLWCALGVFALTHREIFESSVSAAIQNVFLDGASWGSTLAVLIALVCLSIAFTRSPSRTSLRFFVTSYFPFVLLLAHLREGAYRVGDGDSMSRMLIHVVPIAVLLVVSTAAADWRFAADSRRIVD